MLRRWVALLAGAAVVVAASAVGIGTAEASRPATQPYDKILKTSIRDIQDFWSEQMPAVYGARYAVLPSSHIHAYTAKTANGRKRSVAAIVDQVFDGFTGAMPEINAGSQ